MSLKDLKSSGSLPDNNGSSSNSNGSDGGDSDDSGGFPKFQERYPYAAFYEDDEGRVQYEFNPQNLFISYKKKSEHSGWQKHAQPEELLRCWMDEQEFARVCWMVSEYEGENLRKLMQEDAGKALRAVKIAAKSHSPQGKPPRTESCPVCREKIHVIRGDYKVVDERRVHDHHSVRELADADLI